MFFPLILAFLQWFVDLVWLITSQVIDTDPSATQSQPKSQTAWLTSNLQALLACYPLCPSIRLRRRSWYCGCRTCPLLVMGEKVPRHAPQGCIRTEHASCRSPWSHRWFLKILPWIILYAYSRYLQSPPDQSKKNWYTLNRQCASGAGPRTNGKWTWIWRKWWEE